MKENEYVNFDIHKLINDFDWYDYMSHGAVKTSYGIASGDEYSNGAVLLITNKQYVLSYTEGYGQGVHYYTLYRIIKDLHGGGDMTLEESKKLHILIHNYIWARIIFENGSGYINFTDLNNLNAENYQVFCAFYDDYNETIKAICNKYDFVVRFTYRDEDGKLMAIESKSLDQLLLYLTQNLKQDILINASDDEVIIGREVNYFSKKA